MTDRVPAATAVLHTRKFPAKRPLCCSWILRQVPSVRTVNVPRADSVVPAEGRTQYHHLGLCCHSTLGKNAHIQQEGPDISRLDPNLQQQWDHAANAHLRNIDITPYNSRKVRWVCDQCPDGHLHTWSATVANRTNGNGCPQCSGRKLCKHNSLATKDPTVAAQWDYEKNDGTPDSVVAQTSKLAHWHCDACGYKWRARPSARVSKKKSGCPQCAEVARTAKRVRHPTIAEDPVLLAQWDDKRNANHGHSPDKIRLKSHKQIFWLCNKCPAGQQHSWSAQPFSRTGPNKAGCPCCAGHAACKCNSLQTLFPRLAKEWDDDRNQDQPSNHTAGSNYVAWWFTREKGSWQQPINYRTSNAKRKSARSKPV